MAVSTAARYTTKSVAVRTINAELVASVAVYKGTCVAVFTGGANQGYHRMIADTANMRLVGLAELTATGGSANGDVSVPVQPLELLEYLELDAVSPGDTWVGQKVYFTDDHTVALTSTNSILAGRVVSVEKTGTAGRVVVALRQRD